MQKINRLTIKLIFLFIFFVIIQIPSVFLGLRLAIELTFVPHVVAAERILKIFDLRDKHITTRDRIILRGEAPGTDRVIVNNKAVDLDTEGRFKIGLVVRKGKNLVDVLAKKGALEEKQRIRVLRLIPFFDLEVLYSGKPYWAKKDIMSLATLDIVEGYPDGQFEPKKQVSRGEFATWLVRAKEHKVETPSVDPFFDVPKEHWRAPYIREAAIREYMIGQSKEFFGIDASLSRADVAVIIDRAERLKDSFASKEIFEDVSSRSPAVSAIYRAYKAGLIIGVSKERLIFQPARSMNRAEATKLLSRLGGVKKLVLDLFDFSKDYDESRLCRINTEPVIVWAKASPYEAPRDGETPVSLTVKVDDRQGISDISHVRVDLRQIGGPPDAMMYDDGTFGDEKAEDGIYTLEIPVYEDVELGVRRLRVVAMDKSGWEGEAWLEVFVVRPW